MTKLGDSFLDHPVYMFKITCTLKYAHCRPHADTFQASTVALSSSHNRLDACNVMYIGGIITSWRRLRAICNSTLLDVSVTSLHTFTAAAASTPRRAVFAVNTSLLMMYFTLLLAADMKKHAKKETHNDITQYYYYYYIMKSYTSSMLYAYVRLSIIFLQKARNNFVIFHSPRNEIPRHADSACDSFATMALYKFIYLLTSHH